MAYPIMEYLNLFDVTYRPNNDPKGHFGHLIIRDSNTAFNDYLLIGCNSNSEFRVDY